jgi:hypothetical protein
MPIDVTGGANRVGLQRSEEFLTVPESAMQQIGLAITSPKIITVTLYSRAAHCVSIP